MTCPRCHRDNPPQAKQCAHCGAPLHLGDATLSGTGSAMGEDSFAGVTTYPAAFQPGTVLNNRYEIQGVLGEGGMGAVYKALDRELDRLVALKVIRPELASNPRVLQRFKNELVLARKVTHKNVNRIFDLGESEGTKFISMEYVDGQDLKSLVRERGKLSPEEALPLVIQICRALDAAHSEGVVHRDLKPQNIMVDRQGKVHVMDFGLAASTEMTGFTQTGALLGTPEYMSPEQAKGEKADTRSDLFAFGIIFYELLTGETPYKTDSAYSSLLKRTQERAVPVSTVDASIPRHFSEIVSKCLEIDPQRRYQTALEIIEDLEAQRRPQSASLISYLPFQLRTVTESKIWLKAAVVVGAALLVVALPLWFFWLSSSPPPATTTSLAVLPFQNASGNPELDWLGTGLADMLTTDLGESEAIRTVSPDRLYQLLRDLRISSASSLDAAMLSRVAEFSSADILVSGKYVKLGEQIRIDATLHDLQRNQTVPLKADAAAEENLLQAINALAASIHDNLAQSGRSAAAAGAQGLQPVTESVEALRYYNEGIALVRQGRNLEAVEKLEASLEADPEFALAHARLGQTYASLGYGWEAERFSRQAVDLSHNLPEQQRYLILAHHARITNDLEEAIEAYKHLLGLMPANTQFQFELGKLYEARGEFDQAMENYGQVLAKDPQHLEALLAAGNVENKRQNFQAALDHLNRALSLAIQLDNQESKAKILHSLGYAYQWMNRHQEALRQYQEALALREQLQDQKGMAQSLVNIAQVYDLEGQPAEAGARYERALAIFREIGDQKGIGSTLMNYSVFLQDRGQYEDALKLAKEALQVQIELGNEHLQAMSLSNIGALYYLQTQYNDALTYYERALRLREKLDVPIEIAETQYNLGEASARMGQYDEALTHYLRALEIWRQAGDQLGVGYASYGMGTLFLYQGRYGAALDAMKKSFETFQELQERSLWSGEVQAAYGNALALVGHTVEARKHLDESLTLARELKNPPLIARAQNFQGDVFYYQNELQQARNLYQQARETAQNSDDQHARLVTDLSLAKIEVRRGSGKAVANKLATLAREADSLGLKYLSTECSIYRGEALLNAKDYSEARQELDRALRVSERLGQKALRARSHLLLARLQTASGNEAGAARHYSAAATLFEEMQSEAGSNPLLKRADLAAVYTEATRASGAPRP